MDEIVENEITNDVTTENTVENNVETKQSNFLVKALGTAINTAVDTALRVALPNAIEDQVINVKNILLKEGMGEGIKSAINSAISLGKSAIGMITGKFENVSQAYTAVKSGGLIDATSKIIDSSLKSATKNGLISDATAKLIKKGKNAIKSTVSSNIEKTFLDQVDSVEKLGKYITNWNNYLVAKDTEGMEKEYKKIQEKMETVLPLETTLKEVEEITNIQTLIKNKGGIENVTNEEIELAKKLTTTG